jgi:hypothetical protein
MKKQNQNAIVGEAFTPEDDFIDSSNGSTGIDFDNPTLPLVHLNGSGEKALLNQYRDLFEAVSNAVNVFEGMEFHSRDYYPLGDVQWEKARAERLHVFEAMQLVYKYSMDHLIYLQTKH